jgi:SAM-dependent methyltransferase
LNEKIKNILKPKYRLIRKQVLYVKTQKKILELKILKLRFKITKTESKNYQKNKVKKKNIQVQDIISSQKIIDSLAYPPNHDYDLETLKPRGELRLRLDQIKVLDPDFFKGNKFLDIGCNKGFFSLLASQYANKVCSIDTDIQRINLCNMIKQENMVVEHTSFRNFTTNDQFDKILLGNVHHYLFKECGGWEWIHKLAVISTDTVIFEGPVDMTCKDMKNVIPDNLKKEFTFEKFMGIMSKFFTLEIKIDSILPQRYVMHFKRKKDDLDNIYQVEQIPIKKILKDDRISSIFLTLKNNKKMVAKIIKNPREDLKNRINIARMSPISNGVIGSIYNGDMFIGWIEEYREDEICKYKEKQKEIFKKLCDHNVFLSKMGYFDTDVATINFFKTDLKLFDKGLVMPIKSLNQEVYENFQNSLEGYYFIHLRNSFDIIDEKTINLIKNSLKSKDSSIIEKTFLELKNHI